MGEAAYAAQNGYNKADYQSGWGIGNPGNMTMGFNNFNDSNAVRNEIGRLDAVMANRTKFGLDNTA